MFKKYAEGLPVLLAQTMGHSSLSSQRHSRDIAAGKKNQHASGNPQKGGI